MRPSLIIFDCDGVLVDSEPIASRVLAECLLSEGLSWSVHDVDRRFRGRSLGDCLYAIESELGRPLSGNFLGDLNQKTYRAFETDLRPVEGAFHALSTVTRAGIPVCVASSGTLEKMRLTLGLTGLLSYFEGALFSASEVQRGKPAPDLFLHAAKQMACPIEEACVIEDSLPGVTGALTAGARALGYVEKTAPDSLKQTQEMTRLGAVTFHEMRELPALLGAC